MNMQASYDLAVESKARKAEIDRAAPSGL